MRAPHHALLAALTCWLRPVARLLEQGAQRQQRQSLPRRMRDLAARGTGAALQQLCGSSQATHPPSVHNAATIIITQASPDQGACCKCEAHRQIFMPGKQFYTY